MGGLEAVGPRDEGDVRARMGRQRRSAAGVEVVAWKNAVQAPNRIYTRRTTQTYTT